MENAELDVALEELESRLERLRALYEQYFMGIERIEPAIPRKDIDRRIYVLRREKIRNTAKRFKLQTIIARYNTFQQYWQRICREIENGTYKRHVIKAERIAPGQILTIAARKRLGRRVFQDDAEADSRPPAGASSVPPAAASSAPPARRTSVLPPLAALAQSGLRPASIPPAPGVGGLNSSSRPPTLKSDAAKAAPPPKPATRPAKPTTSPVRDAPPPSAFESLNLDMEFMGDWDPSGSAKNPKGASGPERPFGQSLAQPLGSSPAASPPPKPSLPRSASTAERAPLPSPTTRGAPTAVAAPQASTASPKSAVSGDRVAPASPVNNVAPTANRASAPAKPTLAKPDAADMPPAARLGAAPIAKVAAPKPAPPAPAVISDDRVREIHARLIEAKRQTQDAGSVSVEGLAKSLKATEAKLREQHKNRRIDFDVVIKDGKAVLKPIVR